MHAPPVSHGIVRALLNQKSCSNAESLLFLFHIASASSRSWLAPLTTKMSSMETDVEAKGYAIHPRRRLLKVTSESQATSIDTGSLHDSPTPHGHGETQFEPRRGSDAFNHTVLGVSGRSQKNKHDAHALLVPIREGNELGYFSTVSAAFPCCPLSS